MRMTEVAKVLQELPEIADQCPRYIYLRDNLGKVRVERDDLKRVQEQLKDPQRKMIEWKDNSISKEIVDVNFSLNLDAEWLMEEYKKRTKDRGNPTR